MLPIVLGANDVFLYFLSGLPLDSGCLFIIGGISVRSWLCLLFFLWNPQGVVVRVSRLVYGARLGHVLAMWPSGKSPSLSGPCFFLF